MRWQETKTTSKQRVKIKIVISKHMSKWLTRILPRYKMMYQWPYLSDVCTGTYSWCKKWLGIVKLTYDKKTWLSPHAGPRGTCTMATLEGWPLLPLSVRSTLKVVFLPSWFLAEIIFMIAFIQPASMAYNERYLSKL